MLLGYLLLAFPKIAVVSAFVYLPWGWLAHRRRGKMPFLYHLARYALVGCLLSLAWLTVFWYYPDITFRPEAYFLNLRPFVWLYEGYDMSTENMVRQLVLNVCMFLPYGLLLPVTAKGLRRLWRTGAVVLGTTAAIETVQYFIGRSADVDDVLMNLLGGVLGYLLYALLNRLLGDKPWWKAAKNLP